jgi:hypothetical protein
MSTISPTIPKLSTAQQRLLLSLLGQGATEAASRTVPKTYKRAGTVRVLKRLDLLAEDNVFNPQYYYLHFTPAGMSIARELRRMRFQEPKPFAVRT